MRAGFWGRAPRPFKYIANWIGEEDMFSLIPGERRELVLEQGTVVFRRGVLFHPTAPRGQALEHILILETTSPDMFDYDCWEEVDGYEGLEASDQTVETAG